MNSKKQTPKPKKTISGFVVTQDIQPENRMAQS